MATKIRFESSETITCGKDWMEIKNQLEKIDENETLSLNNIEMECKVIVDCDIIGFCVSLSSLLVAFFAVYVALLKDYTLQIGIGLSVLFPIVIVALVVWGIIGHRKRCAARKILYVIETIRNEYE